MGMKTEDVGNREYRSDLFRYIFKEEENFVQMYETFTGKKLLPEEIEFFDTDSLVLSKMLKNDVSFMTNDGKFIILVEHQSTPAMNMYARMLIYYSEILKIYIAHNRLNIYGEKPINLPKAELFVAYNGKKTWLDEDKQRKIEIGDISINVKLVDINYEQLPEVRKENNNPLAGYAYFIQQIVYYESKEDYSLKEAIHQAAKDCKIRGYLEDYVNRKEFLAMVTEVWTIKQQLIDGKRWAEERAREEERKKAEIEKMELMKKIETEKTELMKKVETEKLENAKAFLAMGMSTEDVARGLGFELEIIENLKKLEMLNRQS